MNLTPEVAFGNNITNTKGAWSTFWPTWLEAAKTDALAHFLTGRYMRRPAEELYNVLADPYERNNLADDPSLERVKSKLRARLLEWMESHGDEGQPTEMIADRRSSKTQEGRETLRRMGVRMED